jgi:aldehyde dehydrogenase (NAD+)
MISQKPREFFASGATRALEFRKQQLRKMGAGIVAHEASVLAALKSDLGKSTTEAYLSEVGFLYDEIRFAIKHLDRWSRPRKVPTPWLQWPARSEIHYEPVGTVLVIGPWNYPFQLVLAPLIGAIAAGNTAVLKPSELAPRTSTVVAEIIRATFDEGYVTCVEGGVDVSTSLLAERFDHIFYTGGAAVGRVVMTAAAKYLTPVTLELGGKSPCIVDATADLEVTARRVVWGKFFNAGQTCVAPDYLLVAPSVKRPLVDAMKAEIGRFFGPDPKASPDYGRIINDRHFTRLTSLLRDGKILMGGENDAAERYLAPTFLEDPAPGARVMEDEIFGPILPILEYENAADAIRQVNSRSKPLALYLFSRDRAFQERVLSEVPFGGGCVNDTLIHLSNPHLPFGGVGESGMGNYHGEFGFQTFSHRKSLIRRSFLFDLKLRYPPYRLPLPRLKQIMRPPA